MPLFRWMKRSCDVRMPAHGEATLQKTSGGESTHTLITELLWHVKQREKLMRDLERENRLAQSAPGLQWFQKYPRLQTLISTSELHQLEFLCGQIPPIHAATVLSRFREVLATNSIRPWELASVFKQVLTDFLSREVNLPVQQPQPTPTKSCTCHYKKRQDFPILTETRFGHHSREEIPTISGYVDGAMQHSGSIAVSNMDWSLSYYHSFPLKPI